MDTIPKRDDLLISMYYKILETIKPHGDYTPEDAKKVASLVFSKDVTDQITNEFMKDLKTRESDTIEGIKTDLSQNRDNIEKIWGKSFDLIWLFVNISNEIAITYCEDIKSSVTDDNRSLLSVLLQLHNRGCDVASEIVTLLISGHTDGAYARWRTLHEINITANFIAEYGNNIAKRYLDYHCIDEYKNVMKLQTNHEKLGLAPMSKTEEDEYKRKRTELKDKYGKNYVEDYGWAWPIFSKEKTKKSKSFNNRLTFAEIEKKVNFDQWRPYFGLASQQVHASSRSLVARIDPRHIGNVTIISLHQLTSALTTKHEQTFNSKSLFGLMILDRYKMEIFQELDKSALERDKIITKLSEGTK
jgi:hypothetical protein